MKEAYYLQQLEDELVIALGCTEPIAVAYAASLARREAGYDAIEKLVVSASPNIYKNAMGVYIPGTEEKGVAMAAAMGAIAGDPDRCLEVLEKLENKDIETARDLIDDQKVILELSEPEPTLYIKVLVETASHSGSAVIAYKHDLILELSQDNELVFQNDMQITQELEETLVDDDISNIWDFVQAVDLTKLGKIRQALDLNMKIADAGLEEKYGLEVGSSIREQISNMSLSDYCASRTAAAADARMAGAIYPVMGNSGSGNQGLTATVSVAAAAEYLDSDEEALLRAVTLSHLLAIHVKKAFGRLSPLCGAVPAAIGASGGIVSLLGGGVEEVIAAAQNMFGTLTGMICDGAKAGCALKVSICIYAAVQAAAVAMQGNSIKESDGMIGSDVEESMKNVNHISKAGLVDLDSTLLEIMMNKSRKQDVETN
ncbi:MAG: L-serine ammonia-lyase, iron-sulfur-dependent, subunit alpha [Eubacteriales bacterium]|nr:L-serine ammonia-lyase, iron-sulfur-dependent, subunit alpha [Eubacteriales bacterium]